MRQAGTDQEALQKRRTPPDRGETQQHKIQREYPRHREVRPWTFIDLGHHLVLQDYKRDMGSSSSLRIEEASSSSSSSRRGHHNLSPRRSHPSSARTSRYSNELGESSHSVRGAVVFDGDDHIHDHRRRRNSRR